MANEDGKLEVFLIRVPDYGEETAVVVVAASKAKAQVLLTEAIADGLYRHLWKGQFDRELFHLDLGHSGVYVFAV